MIPDTDDLCSDNLSLSIHFEESEQLSEFSSKKSNIWNYFEKHDQWERTYQAKCKQCSVSRWYKCTKGSTSSLWYHIKKEHIKLFNDIKGIRNNSSVISLLHGVKEKERYNNEKLLDLVSNYIIKCDLPFSIIDDSCFHSILHYLEPEVKLVKRKAIAAKVMNKFDLYREKMI
jgi:hypothetical protein